MLYTSKILGKKPFIHLHSALAMEAECTSETLTPLYQITSPRIIEDTASDRGTVSVTRTIIKVFSSHTCVNSFFNQPVQPNTPSSAIMSAKSKVGHLSHAADDSLQVASFILLKSSLYWAPHTSHQRVEFREFKAGNLCILMYLSAFLCVSSVK